jgi:hypothetical protein
LSAALAGCGNGDDGTLEDLDDITVSEPGVKKPAGSVYTIDYQTGNGTGISWSDEINKNASITTLTLPGKGELIPPGETAVFVGWNDNDGMLTYPEGYNYTVTENVTFKARWAFTALEEIKTYLDANDTPVLIAVADGEDTNLTWKNLLLAIKEAGKTVELDLSGSTLALFGESEKSFDYKDGRGAAYNTGEPYIKKLILSRDATLITNGLTVVFSKLEGVSGLNISTIPQNAFWEIGFTSKLATVVFPAATSINTNAFYICANLTSVSLPAAVTLGNAVFYDCTNLTSVSLPAAVTLGNAVFGGCTNLTSVNLPAAASIDKGAFSECGSLTTITIAGECEIKTGDPYSGLGSQIDRTIHDNFKAYYYSDTEEHPKQAAGVYTYSDSKWSYKALAGTS